VGPRNNDLDATVYDDEQVYEISLRPSRFDEFVGQNKIKDNLRVFVEAAKRRGDPMDHVLFCGPPGLGKTTLALILAEERGVQLHSASAPAIEHKGQLAALLTKLQPHDVLFIDEIHRLPAVVEENLYSAVEDFRIDIVQGDGPYAQTLSLPIHPFTLAAATTRTGLLTNPMRTRFGYIARLDYYPPDQLARIITRSANLLNLPISEQEDGGQVGWETWAAALSEPRDTLDAVDEPYLLQQGFIARTPRGRMATRHAYRHLGRKPAKGAPGSDAEGDPGKQKELF